MKTIKVPSKFKPLYEHDVLQKLFYVFHGGRGGGKSWAIADFLLLIGATTKHRILCCREVQKSISQSVHKLLSDRIQALGFGAFYEITNTQIKGQNGTEFSFSGLLSHTVESVKSFEGATITWVEEAQTISRYSLNILIPTVVRTDKPMVIMSLNPDLPTDAVYQDYIAQVRDDTVVVKVDYMDNPYCPSEIITLANQLKETDFGAYEHIYLGMPKMIADGAIYKAEFERIAQENRICHVPHEPNLPVFTSWDLGILDSTAIWFFQIYGKEVRVIDHYEANNEPLSHYANVLFKKRDELGYQYGGHFAPHDIAVRDLSTGKSRIETMAQLGVAMQIGARLGVDDRIEATRQLLANCYFDKDRCQFGIKALQNYKRAFNDKLQEFTASVVHDWASHSADAFGEGAINISKMQVVPKVQAQPIPTVTNYWN